jgi:uncharacterized protein YpmB
LSQYIPYIIGGVFILAIILISAFTFGKFMEPAKQVGASAEVIVQTQLETAKVLQEIRNDLQTIKGNIGGNQGVVVAPGG